MKTAIVSLFAALTLLIAAPATLATQLSSTETAARVKLHSSMTNFATLLDTTMAKWGKDVQKLTDYDQKAVVSIKAMTLILDALSKLVKEVVDSDVDVAIKEQVITGLRGMLVQLTEMRAVFTKDLAESHEFKKLLAENTALLKKVEDNIKLAFESWETNHRNFLRDNR